MPIWSYLPGIILIYTLPFVWKKCMCIHSHIDICVKFCDYLWRETQESDCPYGEKPGAWEQLPKQRELVFFYPLAPFESCLMCISIRKINIFYKSWCATIFQQKTVKLKCFCSYKLHTLESTAIKYPHFVGNYIKVLRA